jgi:hypothetical protein
MGAVTLSLTTDPPIQGGKRRRVGLWMAASRAAMESFCLIFSRFRRTGFAQRRAAARAAFFFNATCASTQAITASQRRTRPATTAPRIRLSAP